MKKSPSVQQLGETLGCFFRRYHVILFSLTIVIGVSAAVFMLNNLLVISARPTTEGEASVPSISFDQETIKAIEEFSTSADSPEPFNLPSGRINPLVD